MINPTLKAKLVLDINNMASFVESFAIDSPLLLQIKSKENLKMQSDFMASTDVTSFSDINIQSESIKGKGSVDLFYEVGKNSEAQWDISLDIDQINIDKLTKEAKKPVDENEVINYYMASTQGQAWSSYNFNLPSNLSALFDLSLKEIIYNNDKITNISIDTDILNGKAIINSFSADFPGNSKFEFSGNIDHNGIRPLLIGKIKAYGDNLRAVTQWLYPQYSFIPEKELQEFLFSCDFNITPRKMAISNIYGSVDKFLLGGSVFIRPSDTIPSIQADLKLDRLDLDRYNATEQIDIYLKDFFTAAKDRSIDSSWLKLFKYNLALSISGDEITYNNNKIKKISSSIGIVKGLMRIQNIIVDSELLNIQGDANFDFNKEEPEIDLNINAKYINTKAFIVEKEMPEEENNPENKNVPGSLWSKDNFNLMGIDRFIGSLDLSVDKFTHNNLNLKNISIAGNLKNDIFSIDKFLINMGNTGKIIVKGNIGLSSEAPSIGISVTTSDLDIKDILQAAGSKNKTEGKLYIGGVIKTFGKSSYDWIKEMQATIKLATRNAKINGIDISTIIDQSRKLYSVIDMDQIIKKSTNSGITRFLAADGSITIEKSILQAKNIALATSKSRGVLAGNMSLHNLKMKALAKISYIPEVNKKVTLKLNLDGTVA